jgi:hypothetical protein
VQDLRWGEPGCVEFHKTLLTEGWEWRGADGQERHIRHGETRQALHGKIVLLRAHPRLKYLRNPHYVGLHSHEFETAIPHNYRICETIWYVHLEWVRSNRRLYEKAILYYDLVADPHDYCHTPEFRDRINPENVLTEQRVRPFLGALPAAMAGFTIPAVMTVVPDQFDRLAIIKRHWTGEEW